jgi:hypothetical protein
MMKLAGSVACVAGLAFFAVANGQPKAPEPAPAAQPAAKLTAAELIEKVKAKYSGAKTYRDEGVLTATYQTAPRHTETKPFSTAFERNGGFLWEFRAAATPGAKPTSKYVVWSKNQKQFASWWTVKGKQDSFTTFDMAMAGPTGISGGSATAVVPLLRGIRVTDFGSLRSPELKGQEKIDGINCQILTGKSGFSDGEETYWIDADSAIRKIRRVETIDPTKAPGPDGKPGVGAKFTVDTVITFQPEFDVKMEPKAFEFVPPGKK